MQSIAVSAPTASVSKREVRNLAKRLALSERSELRGVARALDKALAGEAIVAPHVPPCTCHGAPCWRVNEKCSHATCEGSCCWLGCAGCEHDPIACPECLPLTWIPWVLGTAFEGADLAAPIACLPSTASEDWFSETLKRARDGAPPPAWFWWERDTHDLGARAACEAADRFIDATAELVREVRFGKDPRKARAAKRAAIRKGMDLSCYVR